MTEQVDSLGLWWLPDRDDHRVPGRFVWNQESGGELHLIGQLIPDIWEDHALPDGGVQKVRTTRVGREGRTYPIIHGQIGRRAFTLLDSFSTRREDPSIDVVALEKVHVNRALESSAWFLDADDLKFDRASVELRHLTAWIDRSGISVDNPMFDGTGDLFAVISVAPLPALKVVHGEGTVSFAQTLRGTGDNLHSAGVDQRWDLNLSFPTVRSLDVFTDLASDLQDLVSIAVGTIADFDRLTLQHPDVPLRSVGGTPIRDFRDEVVYRAKWSNRSENTETVKPHDRYFSFEDFGEMAGVARWLEIAQTYRTELGRVMATRYSSSMHLEDRVMNVCAALDSFDKVRRNTGDERINFVERIKECVAFGGGPILELLPADTDAWAKKVKEVRHDLAHHKDRFRQNAIQIDHFLSEQLYWLFAICLLRLSGASNNVFVSIGKHGQIRWLSKQAGVSNTP